MRRPLTIVLNRDANKMWRWFGSYLLALEFCLLLNSAHTFGVHPTSLKEIKTTSPKVSNKTATTKSVVSSTTAKTNLTKTTTEDDDSYDYGNYDDFSPLPVIEDTTMHIETTTPKDVDYILRSTKIIPDVVLKKPPLLVYASYYHFAWDLGKVFDSTDVPLPPNHIWWVSQDGFYYTLLVVGPDFPGEDNRCLSQYQHWVVVNIPGIFVEGGEILSEYLGAESYGRGRHRIVILVFKQPGKEKIKFNETFLTRRDRFEIRGNFSALRFAKKYNLGDPIAINYCILDMNLMPTPYY